MDILKGGPWCLNRCNAPYSIVQKIDSQSSRISWGLRGFLSMPMDMNAQVPVRNF
ncbi:hypothetical protein BC835DRAFT_1370650, partial [Cytidiella melzeri]